MPNSSQGTPDYNSMTLLKKYYDKYPEDVDKILLNVKGCLFPGFRLDCSPEGVKTSVENCVRLIGGKGRIDQFESPRKDHTVDIEITMEAMNEQLKAGNIGSIALSEVSASTIYSAAKVAKITCVEIEFSMWNMEAMDNGVLIACSRLGIPVVAYGEPSPSPSPSPSSLLFFSRNLS
jgi:pyridoxine 4-dehydrogenase